MLFKTGSKAIQLETLVQKVFFRAPSKIRTPVGHLLFAKTRRFGTSNNFLGHPPKSDLQLGTFPLLLGLMQFKAVSKRIQLEALVQKVFLRAPSEIKNPVGHPFAQQEGDRFPQRLHLGILWERAWTSKTQGWKIHDLLWARPQKRLGSGLSAWSWKIHFRLRKLSSNTQLLKFNLKTFEAIESKPSKIERRTLHQATFWGGPLFVSDWNFIRFFRSFFGLCHPFLQTLASIFSSFLS